MTSTTLIHYIVGFLASIALTVLAFGVLVIHETSHHEVFSHSFIFAAIVFFAIIQMLIQVILFLHLGSESKPRWNLSAFVFAVLVVAIVVGGTLWIMSNLQHGMDHVLYSGAEASPQGEEY